MIINFKAFNDYKESQQAAHQKQSKINLILKIILVAVKPNPYFQEIQVTLESINNYQIHSLNNLLAVISLFQIFMVFPLVFNSSIEKNARSSRVCNMYGCKATYIYAVRTWFKKNHFLRLGCVFIIWFLICAFALRMAEYRYNSQIQSLQSAIWLTFSTMFCVGFGDVFPLTNLGKWIALAVMYTGVIIVYVTIIAIKSAFKLNKRERRALKLLITLQKKSQLKKAASLYIRQSLWRVWLNKKGLIRGVHQTQTLKQRTFRKKMKQLRINSLKDNLSARIKDQFTRNFDKTLGYIDNLKTNNQRLINFLDSSIGNKNQVLLNNKKHFT